jgi:GMP synthase (glutamine-hydrolysing)
VVSDLLIVKAGETFPSLSKRRGDFEDWIKDSLLLDPGSIILTQPFRGEHLPDPGQLSGVVITGSNAMVTDRHDWSERTAGWIPSVIEAGIPLLGICYGHQLMAHAMGGTVGSNPAGIEMGTVDIQIADIARNDPLFGNFPAKIRVQASHFQSVIAPPPGVSLLASSVLDPYHVFSYGSNVWSVQFHPEFDADITDTYIVEYSDALRAGGINPEDLQKTVQETPYGRLILKRFGEIVKEEDG